MHTYKNRKHAFEKEVTWTLEDGQLKIESEEQIIKSIQLNQIARIRLSYIPTRARLNNYSCKISSVMGEDEFTSTQFISFANFKNTGKAYTDFVKALIQAVFVDHPSVELVSGKPALSYYINNTIMLVSFGLLAVLIFFLGDLLTSMSWIKFILILAMLPYAIRYMQQNKPGNFSANQIPEKLLPK